MPHYHSLGKIPPKRHTQFRQANGTLYSEQLFSTEGFSSNSSLLYHVHPPTQIIKTEEPVNIAPVAASANILKHRSFKGFKIAPEADYIKSRKTVLFNNDVQLTLAAPTKGLTDNVFYKNADTDEVLFIHEGKGTLHTQYGQIPFGYGDYVVVHAGLFTRYLLRAKTIDCSS